MTQRTRFKIVAYSMLLLLLVASLGFWVNYQMGRGRDAERLGDMKIAQQILARYFFQSNTYQLPQCETSMTIDQCASADKLLMPLSGLIDPINSTNQYQYRVRQLSADNFALEVRFEHSIAGLAPGAYLVTKDGFKR